MYLLREQAFPSRGIQAGSNIAINLVTADGPVKLALWLAEKSSSIRQISPYQGFICLDVNYNVHLFIMFAIGSSPWAARNRVHAFFAANQARQNNPNLQSYFSSHWSQQATTFISYQKLSFD
jgi:hypothetical protein